MALHRSIALGLGHVGGWLGASAGFGQKADPGSGDPFRRPTRGDLEQTRMSNDRIPMSKEGYEKKKAQLDNRWKNEHEMPRDRRTNRTGHAGSATSPRMPTFADVVPSKPKACFRLRINDLQNMLGQAYIVEKSTVPSDRVVYGSKVRVVDLSINGGRRRLHPEFGPGEEDYDQNKILLTSPIKTDQGRGGQEGRRTGREVQIPARRSEAQDR